MKQIVYFFSKYDFIVLKFKTSKIFSHFSIKQPK